MNICICNKNISCDDCLNNPKEFEKLSEEKKEILCEWIENNLNNRRKTINTRVTSYGLKHKFEESKKGFYITNGCFKGAMIEMSFNHSNGVNWCFNLSSKLS